MQVHTVRGKGAILRSSLSEDVTPERVRDAWSKVTDMNGAEHLGSITEATGSLVGVLDTLMSDNQNTNAVEKQNGAAEDIFSYNYKDLIIYALGGTVNEIENQNENNRILFFFFLQSVLR